METVTLQRITKKTRTKEALSIYSKDIDHDIVSQLRRAGLVRREHHGQYFVTEYGKEVLKQHLPIKFEGTGCYSSMGVNDPFLDLQEWPRTNIMTF